jgi:hypothetical protein
MTVSAQLTIAWNGSTLCVEGASDANGGRAKIPCTFAELPPELREWLDTRLAQLRDRETATLRQRQTDNANYIAKDLRAPMLAERVYGELAFSHALERFRLRDAAPGAKPKKDQVSAEDIQI